ncbi:MAG: hypothetical protein Q9165_008423 [Trypethelium subeluteriae]
MATQPVLVPTASLHGKVALITGAGRGIGRGCAIELGKRGANVVVNYQSSKASADEVVSEIESCGSGAKAISIQADVSKVPEITRLFEETKKHFGRVDIVMSNSGTESWDKTEEITEEKYDHVFNLNARAQFFVGQTAYKYLEKNGRLILMSSIAAGLLGVKDHALYNASKMAVIGMIKSFATDFGKKGITVNGVAPGGIKSDMFTQNAWHYIPGGSPDWSAERIEDLMAQHCPLGRCAVPQDVARVVGFLTSEDGGWINAQAAMHILVTNDDGPPSQQSSPYVHSLVTELQAAGHIVSVILPDTQRSWIGKAHIVGQSIAPTYFRPGTLHADNGTTHSRPYRHSPSSTTSSRTAQDTNGDASSSSSSSSSSAVEEWILIPSTPATCVQLGLHHFFSSRGPVDLVLSGPNYGRNTTAVFALSSGTLGGALEAAVCGRRAIALSYAFFDRENKPEVIREASRHSVRLVEKLMGEEAGRYWEKAHLYSVNVPLVEGVAGKKVLWTEMLQNWWRSGSCFQEVEVPEEEDEGPVEREEQLRRQEVGEEADAHAEATREEKHIRHTHKHFRWAPQFKDVHESVEKSAPGNDGWAIRQGYTR